MHSKVVHGAVLVPSLPSPPLAAQPGPALCHTNQLASLLVFSTLLYNTTAVRILFSSFV